MQFKSFQRYLLVLFFSMTGAALAMEDAKIGQQNEMEHLMPLYEIWILDWVCSNPRYRSEIASSRMDCIREVRDVLPRCNVEYRRKIPRNDSKAVGERLRYRDFMAGYTRCVKKNHKKWRNSKERL